MISQSADEWLQQKRRLAELGDPSAQVDLALAYWHGKVVPKDIDEAVSLLQRAEEKIGEDAWIELLRILCFEKDPRIDDVFRSRLPHSNGIACFIYGKYLAEHNRPEALSVYRAGAQAGHIGCAIRHHVLSHRGIWTFLGFPRLLWLLARGMVLAWRDKDPSRWRV